MFSNSYKRVFNFRYGMFPVLGDRRRGRLIKKSAMENV
jgi:hypothetical protein